jgi:hypothetical protein
MNDITIMWMPTDRPHKVVEEKRKKPLPATIIKLVAKKKPMQEIIATFFEGNLSSRKPEQKIERAAKAASAAIA